MVTASNTALPHGEAEGQALKIALANAGWRFTRQRHAVYSYLRSVHCHPTAEQVYDAVRQDIPQISLATVYKALEALVDAQLATKLSDAAGPARFDSRCDPHYHLRCLATGQVRDLATPFDATLVQKLDPALIESLRQQGFEVTGHRLELVGHFESGKS
jgi:Fur family peroxide stress response transcriptional regulator